MTIRNCVPLFLLMLLTGCGIAPSGGNKGSSPITPLAVTGKVHGGQQPIAGATIQLYAVGNTALKSKATALIGSTVLTAADGSFTITGLWNCNDTATYGSDPLLYITATGGNPGLGAGQHNNAIGLLVALGPCSTLTASTYIFMNELTSVASVYALAAFMKDSTHIGAAAANMAALRGAFQTVNILVNTAQGTTPGAGVPNGETVPVNMLNTLADIVAACINTNGSGVCDTLFQAVTPAGGTMPSDTIGAVLQIAQAPARNVQTIYNTVAPAPPFQPVLAAAPADLSVAIRFTGNGISGPAGVAVDADGNVWIANASGAGVTGLTNQGASLTGPAGFSAGGTIYGAQGIAVDKSGNVWVADTLTSTLFRLTVVSGAVVSSQAITAGLSGPTGVALDKQGNAWVANFADGSVSQFSSSGTLLGNSPLTAGGTLQEPLGVAIDPAGHAWVTDAQAGVAAVFDASQNVLSGGGYTDNAMVSPAGIAFDDGGNAWIAGTGSAGVTVLKNSGMPLYGAPIQGTGLSSPAAVAIDGAGSAWITDASGSLTLVVAGTSIPFAAYGGLSSPAGVAVDASGNVWTANSGDDSVTKFVGMAAPAVVPLAARVLP